MLMEEKRDDGRIVGAKRQKMRALNFDDETWQLVLNLSGKEKSVSKFFRQLIKELDKEQQGKKKK